MKLTNNPRQADKPICQLTFLQASGINSSVTKDMSAPAAKLNMIDK